MPSSKQIVPQYTYPHEEVYITNNSGQDLTIDTDRPVVYPYLCVFASGKGIDNKIVEINSLNAYHDIFGKANFRKYGQPHLMPEAILSDISGATKVWAMRVMPDDATYANMVLSLWYKADEENKKFRIKFTAKTITKEMIDAELPEDSGIVTMLANRDDIIEFGRKFDGTAVDGAYTDEEGYTQVPLGTFTVTGRGVYGNDLRWRIVPDTSYEKEYGYKLFDFECIDVSDGATLVTRMIGSMVSTTKVSEASLINDIIDDADDENLAMKFFVYEENVEKLYEEYKKFFNTMVEKDPTLDVTLPDMDCFDFLFGNEVKKDGVRITPKQPFLSFTTKLTDDIDTTADGYDAAAYTNTEVISLSNAAGNIMMSGSDGVFADPDETVRKAAMNECYIKAFNGVYDRLILAPRRTPSTGGLFDAGYDMEVKLAMAQLSLYRASEPLYLDTGIRNSLGITDINSIMNDFSPLDELVENYKMFDECWNISVNAHHFYIKESSSGKRIPVTITYFLANTDASFTEDHDISESRTGSFARLTGHVKNSLFPAIEENERELKQALNTARINYFECIADNTFERATQNMFIKGENDLLEEGNVKNLFMWKRILEDEARTKRNRLTSAQKREEFRDELLERYDYLRGNAFATMTIEYTANAYEQKRNMTHIISGVSFPSRSKITLIEIDVNKRVIEEEE